MLLRRWDRWDKARKCPVFPRNHAVFACPTFENDRISKVGQRAFPQVRRGSWVSHLPTPSSFLTENQQDMDEKWPKTGSLTRFVHFSSMPGWMIRFRSSVGNQACCGGLGLRRVLPDWTEIGRRNVPMWTKRPAHPGGNGPGSGGDFGL